MAEKVQVQKIKVENVVASTDIKKIISLDKLLNVLESSEYEPEQFPGAILKLKEPKVSMLLFKNGKVICSGASSEKEMSSVLSCTSFGRSKAGIGTWPANGILSERPSSRLISARKRP